MTKALPSADAKTPSAAIEADVPAPPEAPGDFYDYKGRPLKADGTIGGPATRAGKLAAAAAVNRLAHPGPKMRKGSPAPTGPGGEVVDYKGRPLNKDGTIKKT